MSESLNCPRCAVSLLLTGQEFYGPCPTCISELKAKFKGLEREVDAVEYAPKMNVTPNAVALKDD